MLLEILWTIPLQGADFTLSRIFQNIASEDDTFFFCLKYVENFILKILFNFEKRDCYYCIPTIDELYRFLRQIIEKFL